MDQPMQAIFQAEYPLYYVLFTKLIQREFSMKDAKYEWKQLLNIPQLNSGDYFGFDDLFDKFQVSFSLQDAPRMFNVFYLTWDIFEAACANALRASIPKNKMTLQRLFDAYVPNLAKKRRCVCTSICECHSV